MTNLEESEPESKIVHVDCCASECDNIITFDTSIEQWRSVQVVDHVPANMQMFVSWRWEDALRMNEGKIYCKECLERFFEKCESCTRYDHISLMIDFDNTRLCTACTTNTFICERCGNREWSDDSRTVGEDYDCCSSWCERCTDYHASYCDPCDIYHSSDDSCPSRDDDDGRINGYGHKPTPIFRTLHRVQQGGVEPSGHVFLGFEVEVESCGSSIADGAFEFDGAIDDMLVYLKQDGSLRDGFEVVSHPATLEYYDNMRDSYFKPFSALSGLGYAAWRTTTCGMHVHVSRKAFSSQSHLWRFAYFINTHEKQMQVVAGRNASHWATFNGQKSKASKIIAGKAYPDERYTAVNLCPRDTVEIRIFRSSLLPRRIMANLGFVNAIVEFTRSKTVKQITDGSMQWGDFVSFAMMINGSQYDDMRYYINKYYGDTNEDNFIDNNM